MILWEKSVCTNDSPRKISLCRRFSSLSIPPARLVFVLRTLPCTNIGCSKSCPSVRTRSMCRLSYWASWTWSVNVCISNQIESFTRCVIIPRKSVAHWRIWSRLLGYSFRWRRKMLSVAIIRIERSRTRDWVLSSLYHSTRPHRMLACASISKSLYPKRYIRSALWNCWC